ncbi:hypothetical protein N0V85_006108 [Neurospora sp. IMI 360204]|nr:hypothetical protein N0V85_006108 [Neurospora sp. IMI 360204]
MWSSKQDQGASGSSQMGVHASHPTPIADNDNRLRFNQTIEDLNEVKEKWLPRRPMLRPGLDREYEFRFNFLLRPFEEEQQKRKDEKDRRQGD